MKIFLTYILFFILTERAIAQKDSLLKLYKTYKINATDFNADQMGNLYIVTPTAQLKKISEKGDSMAVYNLTKRYGKLTTIDVTNPLKVLLFYKDYSTIVIVDRLLNVSNIIDLRKQNIYQAKAVATTYDGQIWFYDEQDAKIKKINDKGKITAQTVDLRQVLDDLPTPQKIIDNDNLLYLYDSIKGVYIFDYYGALKIKIPLNGWSDFYAFNKKLYGIKKDVLQKYALLNSTEESIPFQNEKIPLKMVVANNRIYFLFSGEIKAYYNK